MMRFIVTVTAVMALASPLRAQTFPAPAAPNNTVVCLWINSTLSVGGTPIGQSQACFGMPDATAAVLIGAFSLNCPAPEQNSCTPPQIVASIGTWVTQVVQGRVMDFLRGQAAQAVQPPALSPVQ